MFNLIYLLLFFSSQAEWREVNELMYASSKQHKRLTDFFETCNG
jgi:hypothetical protein